MLDTDTKRRIDTARDILVGKVPDPKSQVQYITYAMVYKFMDDMDAQNEELGGKRTFFADEFARFGWSKLMAPGLGGEEVMNLYAESLARMRENPKLPALFRDIFKEAFQPFRDAATLKAFLKTINEFEYDHSERLGDAFEYLLSVLGSQGDAGQFRTPRHIIDFIVSIVDPKKNETVLDPACGTSGFLISAYKHIVQANTDKNGNSTLSPDERRKLAENFRGYDISPDMVRLSLVNMYLHGFSDPHIFEYDTLTSQDRWNETAEVILANPPFMSPKGGIKPHNRFSVQSKRSEVLFVDYMAEHLSPSGRAGFIVPEGIIFQSQNAYKQLRKMLVEQYLVAVISLPAGVFQPYSGVKTSILILDRALVKVSDRNPSGGTIGFFKVENDGFHLGAQRRAIERNDLPSVLSEVNEYLRRLRAKEPVLPLSLGEGRGEGASAEDFTTTRGLIVAKEKIAASGGGDYNLSGERYRENGRLANTKWPVVPLGQFCTFMTGGTPTSTVAEYYEGGTVPWLVSGDIHKGEIRDCERRITVKGVENSNARYLPEDSVLIALNGQGKTRGTVAMLRMRNATCNQSLVAISPAEPVRAIPEYIFRVLRSMYEDIRALTGDEERSGLSITIIKTIEIPLPPLDVQKEIVAEIEGYQRVIDGARAILDHYRPHIPIQPDWPMATFADACAEIKTGPFGSLLHQTDYVVDGVPVVNPQDIVEGKIVTDKIKYVSPETRDRLSEFTIKRKDIVIGRRGEMGRCAIATDAMDGWLCGTGCCVIRPSDSCDVRYLALHLQSPSSIGFLDQHSVGVTIKNLNHRILADLPIPLPPLEVQRSIVSEIEAERRLAEANRELIARMETKIAAALARIWGEAEPDSASDDEE